MEQPLSADRDTARADKDCTTPSSSNSLEVEGHAMFDPDLVIFDCDGVLVDSEVIGSRTVSVSLEKFGIQITPEQVAALYTGVSPVDMVSNLRQRFDKPVPADFPAQLQEQLLEVFKRELRAIDGVEEIVKSLECQKCVASSSSLERIERSLSIVGLLSFFQGKLYSATQVAHGKPAPDLFLFAAREMGANPDRCLVIEDSAVGVRAAVSAGMQVLGFTGGSHFTNNTEEAHQLLASGAALTFNDMRKLDRFLAADTFSKDGSL